MTKQIRQDLEGYTEITQGMLDETMALARHSSGLMFVRYRIKDGRVTTEVNQADLKINSRYRIMTRTFQYLASLHQLSDLDFIVCLEDAADGLSDFPGPIFAFAKDMASDNIILVPDFDTIAAGEKSRLLCETKKGGRKYPWHKKVEKAFWRGATTGGIYTETQFLQFPRSKLVTASLKHPELIDARFTSAVQCSDPETIKTLYPFYFGDARSVISHLKYKYQVLIDGNSCAYLRAYWQLFSNSLILKQESRNIQWYYGALKPYVHYVPVENDLSNIVEQIRWAIAHDTEVQEIIDQANIFAEDNLKLAKIYQYICLLLEEYKKRLNL